MRSPSRPCLAGGDEELEASTVAGPSGTERLRLRWWVCLFIGHATLQAPIIVRALYHTDEWHGPNDYYGHVVLASTFAFPTWWQFWHPGLPHPIFHVTVRLVGNLLPGHDVLLAGSIAAMIFAGLGGLAWFWVLRLPYHDGSRMPWRVGAALSFVLLAMEAPGVLAGWQTMDGPHYFMPLFAYHSATGLAARASTAVLFVAYHRVLTTPDDRSERSARLNHALLLAAVLADLTKPGLTLCLLAITPIVPFVQARRDGRTVWQVAKPLVTWYALPSTLLVVAQALVMRYELSGKYVMTTPLQPFRMLVAFGGLNPWFWLVLALPCAMYWAYGRQLLDDSLVTLSVWCFAAGLAVYLVAGSSNPEHTGPEALWLMVQSLGIVLLVSTRRIYELHRDGVTVGRLRVCVLGGVAAVYVAAFIDFTTCQLGTVCLQS